jgi:L-asparaginase II
MLPLVERGHADALGLPDRLLALMAASHNGEPRHVEGARAILEACGRAEPTSSAASTFPRIPSTAGRCTGARSRRARSTTTARASTPA